MRLKEFDVILDNTSKSYFPGQNVSGNVILGDRNESKIEGLAVHFIGQADVCWCETVHETVSDPTTKRKKKQKKVIKNKNEQEYFNCIINLVGKTTIPPGKHLYPFSFTLPLGLPSSFYGKAGQVVYQLKVKVKKSDKKIYEQQVLFTVNGILDLNIEPGASQPTNIRKSKHFGCFCCKSGPVEFAFKLPRRGFVPGEAFGFTVEINNQSRKKVTGIKITLVQNAAFKANGKTYRESKIIHKISGPSVGRGESESWSGDNFNIPAIPPTRLATCQIIDVQYVLKFEMKLAGLSQNLRAEVSIIIGTIPFRSTFSNFTGPRNNVQLQHDRSNVQPHQDSNNVQPHQDSNNAPSTSSVYRPTAPILEGYPDLPPPTYSEAMNFEYDISAPAASAPNIWFPADKFGGVENEGLESDEVHSSVAAAVLSEQKPYAPSYVLYERINI